MAIVAARQETAALSKDGKTLLGPVLPRLLPCHNAGGNRPGQEWRTKGATGNKGGDKPPASRAFHAVSRPLRGKPSGAACKENRGKNATSPPAQKPGPSSSGHLASAAMTCQCRPGLRPGVGRGGACGPSPPRCSPFPPGSACARGAPAWASARAR